jgi:anti-sigma regulatory factor (Ser/Thr protein kinase)
MIIKIERTLDRINIQRALDQVFQVNIEKKYILDLGQIKFVKPYGLVVLLQLMDYLSENSRLEIIYPKDTSVLTYMHRAHFFDYAERYVPIDSWIKGLKMLVHYDENNQTMIDITRIEDKKDIRNTLEFVNNQTRSILVNELNYDSNDVTDFLVVLSELLDNIPRHSLSYGYVCAQTYRYWNKPGRYVSVCISDKGIGIRRSYEESDYLDFVRLTDVKALNLAIIKEKSSKKRGGNGYKGIKEKIIKFGGTLYVRSGTADFTLLTGEGIKIGQQVSSFFGTQIEFILPQK